MVGPAGEQVGIVRIEDALRLAAESDLDLVEVAPMAKPPVCKLMDFGKYKYEAAVKAREARKNQTNTVLKEIRFRLKIDKHDYETKTGHALRFLGAGDKVKAMIQFRGREQQRPEMGIRLLNRFAEDVAEVGAVESTPRIDGRNMVMVIGPLKNKAEAKAEARRVAQRAEAKAQNAADKDGSVRDGSAKLDVKNGAGPMTQSLADLLPDGLNLTSAGDHVDTAAEPEDLAEVVANDEAKAHAAEIAEDVIEAEPKKDRKREEAAAEAVAEQRAEKPASKPAGAKAPAAAKSESKPAAKAPAAVKADAKPAAAKPAAAKPAAEAKPVAKPVAAKPAMPKPPAKPVAPKPAAAKPAAAKPAAAKPATPKPATSRAAKAAPKDADSKEAEPKEVESTDAAPTNAATQ